MTAPVADTGTIRCLCSFTEDDGETIFCELCGYWQHTACVGLANKKQEELPELWYCWNCRPECFEWVDPGASSGPTLGASLGISHSHWNPNYPLNTSLGLDVGHRSSSSLRISNLLSPAPPPTPFTPKILLDPARARKRQETRRIEEERLRKLQKESRRISVAGTATGPNNAATVDAISQGSPLPNPSNSKPKGRKISGENSVGKQQPRINGTSDPPLSSAGAGSSSAGARRKSHSATASGKSRSIKNLPPDPSSSTRLNPSATTPQTPMAALPLSHRPRSRSRSASGDYEMDPVGPSGDDQRFDVDRYLSAGRELDPTENDDPSRMVEPDDVVSPGVDYFGLRPDGAVFKDKGKGKERQNDIDMPMTTPRDIHTSLATPTLPLHSSITRPPEISQPMQYSNPGAFLNASSLSAPRGAPTGSSISRPRPLSIRPFHNLSQDEVDTSLPNSKGLSLFLDPQTSSPPPIQHAINPPPVPPSPSIPLPPSFLSPSSLLSLRPPIPPWPISTTITPTQVPPNLPSTPESYPRSLNHNFNHAPVLPSRPNAVVRPLLCESQSASEVFQDSGIFFGLFPLHDIKLGERIVVGWEPEASLSASTPGTSSTPRVSSIIHTFAVCGGCGKAAKDCFAGLWSRGREKRGVELAGNREEISPADRIPASGASIRGSTKRAGVIDDATPDNRAFKRARLISGTTHLHHQTGFSLINASSGWNKETRPKSRSPTRTSPTSTVQPPTPRRRFHANFVAKQSLPQPPLVTSPNLRPPAAQREPIRLHRLDFPPPSLVILSPSPSKRGDPPNTPPLESTGKIDTRRVVSSMSSPLTEPPEESDEEPKGRTTPNTTKPSALSTLEVVSNHGASHTVSDLESTTPIIVASNHEAGPARFRRTPKIQIYKAISIQPELKDDSHRHSALQPGPPAISTPRPVSHPLPSSHPTSISNLLNPAPLSPPSSRYPPQVTANVVPSRPPTPSSHPRSADPSEMPTEQLQHGPKEFEVVPLLEGSGPIVPYESVEPDIGGAAGDGASPLLRTGTTAMVILPPDLTPHESPVDCDMPDVQVEEIPHLTPITRSVTPAAITSPCTEEQHHAIHDNNLLSCAPVEESLDEQSPPVDLMEVDPTDPLPAILIPSAPSSPTTFSQSEDARLVSTDPCLSTQDEPTDVVATPHSHADLTPDDTTSMSIEPAQAVSFPPPPSPPRAESPADSLTPPPSESDRGQSPPPLPDFDEQSEPVEKLEDAPASPEECHRNEPLEATPSGEGHFDTQPIAQPSRIELAPDIVVTASGISTELAISDVSSPAPEETLLNAVTPVAAKPVLRRLSFKDYAKRKKEVKDSTGKANAILTSVPEEQDRMEHSPSGGVQMAITDNHSAPSPMKADAQDSPIVVSHELPTHAPQANDHPLALSAPSELHAGGPEDDTAGAMSKSDWTPPPDANPANLFDVVLSPPHHLNTLTTEHDAYGTTIKSPSPEKELPSDKLESSISDSELVTNQFYLTASEPMDEPRVAGSATTTEPAGVCMPLADPPPFPTPPIELQREPEQAEVMDSEVEGIIPEISPLFDVHATPEGPLPMASPCPTPQRVTTNGTSCTEAKLDLNVSCSPLTPPSPPSAGPSPHPSDVQSESRPSYSPELPALKTSPALIAQVLLDQPTSDVPEPKPPPDTFPASMASTESPASTHHETIVNGDHPQPTKPKSSIAELFQPAKALSAEPLLNVGAVAKKLQLAGEEEERERIRNLQRKVPPTEPRHGRSTQPAPQPINTSVQPSNVIIAEEGEIMSSPVAASKKREASPPPQIHRPSREPVPSSSLHIPTQPRSHASGLGTPTRGHTPPLHALPPPPLRRQPPTQPRSAAAPTGPRALRDGPFTSGIGPIPLPPMPRGSRWDDRDRDRERERERERDRDRERDRERIERERERDRERERERERERDWHRDRERMRDRDRESRWRGRGRWLGGR